MENAITNDVGVKPERTSGAAAPTRRVTLPFVVGVIVAVMATTAAAESPAAARPAQSLALPLPADAVLTELIEQSLAARPELSQARATAAARWERPSQAGTLPDPMLQLGIQNDGFSGIQIGRMETSYVSVMLSQNLPWPGKLRLRSDVEALGARRAESTVERVRLSTEAEVRRAYVDLLLARDRLDLLARLEGIWQKSAAVARTRYEAGEGAQSDVLRSQLELNRIRQRRLLLQAEENTRVEALNRLRVRPLNQPIATVAHLLDVGIPKLLPAGTMVDEALARSPELSAARIDQAQAARVVDLARKDFFPDFTVSAGIMPRGGDFPLMWTVGVGGNLAVFAWRKQSRAVAERRALLGASRDAAEAVEQMVRLRVQQRRSVLWATLDTIQIYREGLLVQSEATADSTLAQYQVGKAGFASVLEANAGFVADLDGYLQALAEAQRIAIAEAEVSLDPVSIAGAGGAMAGGVVPGAGSMSGAAAPASGSPATQAAATGGASSMQAM